MSPLLMWVFTIPLMIPIVMSVELIGGILLSRQWRVHQEDYPRLWRMLFFSAVTLPLGIWAGSFASIELIKKITSSIIIIFAGYLFFSPHTRVRARGSLDSLAGSLSGILLGSCGIGGPPAALYLNATNMTFDRIRPLLSHFVTGISLFAIVAASFMGGGTMWMSFLLAAIPAYLLGMALGGRLLALHVMSDARMRRLCLMVLIVNASFNLLVLFISKNI